MNPQRHDAPISTAGLNPRALTRVLITVAVVVLAALVLGGFIGTVAAPLVFILLAVILSVGLNPIVVRLETSLRFPRPLAAGAVMLVLIGAFVAFVLLVVPPLAVQGFRFAQRLPDLLHSFQTNVVTWAKHYPMLAPLVEGRTFADPTALLQKGSSPVVSLFSLGATLANFLFSAALLLVLLLFLLMSPEPMLKGLLAGIPEPSRQVIERTLVRVGQQLGAWLVGAILISSIDGVLTALGLWAVGFDSALLFGLIIAVTNVIPVIGPVIGTLPPAFVALANGRPDMALYAALVILAVQQIESYVVSPLVYRRSVQLQPASLVIGVLVFGAWLGMVGVFLTVPLLIIAKAAYEELYLPRLAAPAPPDSDVVDVIHAAGGDTAAPEADAAPVREPA